MWPTAATGGIVKLSPEGTYLSEWGKKGKESGQFATAHDLAIDGADRIYVGDRGNKRVQVFDAEGKHLANWDGFGNPFGLLVVGNELLASEGDIHKIFHLDRRAARSRPSGAIRRCCCCRISWRSIPRGRCMSPK